MRAPNNDQMVDIHTITVTEWCPNQLVIMAAAGGGNLQQKLQPGQMVIMRMSSGEATMRGLWSENGQECPGTPQDQLNFSKGSKMKVASVRGAFFTSEQFSSLWVPVKCVDGVGGVSGGGMFGGGGGGGGFGNPAAGGMGQRAGGFGNPAAGGMFGGQPKPAEEEEEKEPEKDENGYFIGQKCQCRWKYTRGALYNCEISGRNEDGTYSIVYEDGDEDPFPKIDVERLIQDAWKPPDPPKYPQYGGPDQLGKGFYNPNAEGRLTVEVLHRVAKTTSS